MSHQSAAPGPVAPPAHGSWSGVPTPARQRVLELGQSSGRVFGGPAGGVLYIGIGPASLAALARINSKVRRSHASQQRTTDLTQQEG